MKIICPKCDHKQETKSELMKITCSSCGYKIPSPNYKKKKINSADGK